LFYWSSASAQIDPGDVAAGADVELTANFSNTFELVDVELFDINDNPISGWTLEDLTTNTIVFDENGRTSAIIAAPPLGPAVPEPSSWVLLAIGLTAAWSRARRAK